MPEKKEIQLRSNFIPLCIISTPSFEKRYGIRLVMGKKDLPLLVQLGNLSIKMLEQS